MISSLPNNSGLYVHIPFCRKKCIYCDFFCGGASIAKWDIFTENLIKELKSRAIEISPKLRTIYIGGGTPSLIPKNNLKLLVSAIYDTFDCSELKEFSFEVNPEDVNSENIKTWTNLGINRISMGVQSLVDKELSFLNRNHSADCAYEATRILCKSFPEVNVDIMFGIPGQTLSSLEFSISSLLSLHPTHFSAYSLMYEEGTPLTTLRDKGAFLEMDEEYNLSLYKLTSSILDDNGFEHYEISNYAQPGHRSIHNSSYWDFHPYLGVGPSAHSFDGISLRRGNFPDLKYYISNHSSLFNPPHTEESLSAEELHDEYIMLRLRTREGIDLSDFSSRFGKKKLDILISKAESFISNSQLILSQNNLSLSESGIMTSDNIILSLV
ncbi:MAG: radical SAM family heme chaperone HemW [Muribaculaceae bacterium]|nr:radical SAM family heme chaperone HemW [Muribaculaceae bacterium]